MGHKVNPVGFRIGINRNWDSRWYAEGKNYSTYLLEDIALRKYLSKECINAKAGLSHIEIERKKNSDGSVKVDAVVYVSQIGLINGNEGENVKRLNNEAKKLIQKDENLRVTVLAVENPDLDAHIVAQSIAEELENRVSFRTAQKKAISRVRKAGAKGCRTLVGGRLGGADIARNEGYKEGIIPLHTLRSDIDFAIAEAKTTYGRLGVKVWICRGNYKTKEEIEAEKNAPKVDNNRRPHFNRDRRPHINKDVKNEEGGNK